jgi:hypothetical protein
LATATASIIATGVNSGSRGPANIVVEPGGEGEGEGAKKRLSPERVPAHLQRFG